jgi:hypothetical protein
MDVSEWQRRLEENFSVDGIVGGQLLKIGEMERAYGVRYAKTFYGQTVLMDAFQGFYIESINAASEWISNNGWSKDCPNYPAVLWFYVVNFRSFRACENLLTHGYPLDGYGLMRDLKDRAILLAAIAHNITSFPKILGVPNGEVISKLEWPKIKDARKSEERRVLNRMIRKDSGLPSDVAKELLFWESFFHEEVHGSKLSYTEGFDWMLGKEPLSIGPVPKTRSMSMYMNRAVEMAWLFTRLLPFLQPVERAFGPRWREKLNILDDSLRFAVQGLSEVGKKIADAFIVFIDAKFSFSDDFHYFEADGSA